MKIGIDARLYTQTGVGRYLRNLIDHLQVIDTENEYIVYLRAQEYDMVKQVGSKWKKKLLNIPWHTIREQFDVPRILHADNLDVAHFPYFNVPVGYQGRYLLTIHDLIVDHFDTGRASTLPAPLYRLKRLAYHLAMRRGISRASAISVISETTKQEVMDHYHVNPARLTVTYDALDSGFASSAQSRSSKRPYPFPYIVYVGNAYPHKNLERLIDAFRIVRNGRKISLVLAGDDGYFYPRLQQHAHRLGLADDTVFFGNANDTQLIDLYTHARALVFPSLMEGFGLPTFEALACNCLPVISDIPVFREIWADMLPMFDPKNPRDMAAVILSALNMSADVSKRKIRAAAKRIHDFSWEKTAQQTLELYQHMTGKEMKP